MSADTPIFLENVSYSYGKGALRKQILFDISTAVEPGEIIICTGDSHIYSNHVEQVREQLGRDPRSLPRLNILRKPESIYDYRFEDFELVGYDPHPHIAGAVAV